MTDISDPLIRKTVARAYVPSDYTVDGENIWCGKWQSLGAPAQVYLTATESGTREYCVRILFAGLLWGKSWNIHRTGLLCSVAAGWSFRQYDNDSHASFYDGRD